MKGWDGTAANAAWCVKLSNSQAQASRSCSTTLQTGRTADLFSCVLGAVVGSLGAVGCHYMMLSLFHVLCAVRSHGLAAHLCSAPPHKGSAGWPVAIQVLCNGWSWQQARLAVALQQLCMVGADPDECLLKLMRCSTQWQTNSGGCNTPPTAYDLFCGRLVVTGMLASRGCLVATQFTMHKNFVM